MRRRAEMEVGHVDDAEPVQVGRQRAERHVQPGDAQLAVAMGEPPGGERHGGDDDERGQRAERLVEPRRRGRHVGAGLGGEGSDLAEPPPGSGHDRQRGGADRSDETGGEGDAADRVQERPGVSLAVVGLGGETIHERERRDAEPVEGERRRRTEKPADEGPLAERAEQRDG